MQGGVEQSMQFLGWGRKERMSLVAEVLRQKRIAKWLAKELAELSAATMGEMTAEEWIRTAEQEVADDIERERASSFRYSPEG